MNTLELGVSFCTGTTNEYDEETPCFRCEYLEPDTDTGDDKANRFIHGVNVRVGEAPP